MNSFEGDGRLLRSVAAVRDEEHTMRAAEAEAMAGWQTGLHRQMFRPR